MRCENNEKEELISEKSLYIEVLQNNISFLIGQKETVSFLTNPYQNVQNCKQQIETQNLFKATKFPENSYKIINKNCTSPLKEKLSFFDKNIVKPIRGGNKNIIF